MAVALGGMCARTILHLFLSVLAGWWLCVCIFVHRIGVAATGAATAVSRAGITRCTSTRRPSLWSHRFCTSKTHITNQIGAAPEFEMCFAPSTLMPGSWPTKTRLKSSIKKFIPHFIYDWLSLYGMPKRWTTRETSKHTPNIIQCTHTCQPVSTASLPDSRKGVVHHYTPPSRKGVSHLCTPPSTPQHTRSLAISWGPHF